jgi:hypothetical protein
VIILQKHILRFKGTKIKAIPLESEAAKVGLKVNEQKTKYMIAARKLPFVTWSVVIGDKHF